MKDATEFRILGPLEVERDGRILAIGGPKQRAVLSALLLHVNRVVSRDQLIETVWGERPPETATAALQGYVAGLRKTLGSGHIVTRSPGYVLEADPMTIDLGRFEALVRRGHEEMSDGNPAAASTGLRDALGLWRGAPFADLGADSWVATERLRLEELCVGALEDRIDADLAVGRHADLIAELQTLVREHPLRERLCGQLMVALYRSGRQVEALELYRASRRRLAEELGLEPGEALKRLERGILEQDPGLGSVVPPATSRSEPSGRRRRPRTRWVLLGAVALVGGTVAITVAATSGSADLGVRPNSVAVIDPLTNKLVGSVPVGKRPTALAIGAGGVWVANADDRTVTRIDPKTRKPVDTIGIGTDVHDIAAGFGSVWVAGGTEGTITRIKPTTGTRTTLRVGPDPVYWIAAGPGGIWATSGQRVVRIDPSTDKVAASFSIDAEPTGLTTGVGAVWVTTENGILAVSPRGGIRAAAHAFAGNTLAPAVGAGSVWVIVYQDRGVIQALDPVTLTYSPGTETMSAYPLDVAVSRRAVWAVDIHGTVLRIDPASAAVVARIQTAPTTRSAIAAGDGAVWVAIEAPQ